MACGLARGGLSTCRTHWLGAGQRSLATAIATSAEWKVEWNLKPMNHVSVSPCFREVFRQVRFISEWQHGSGQIFYFTICLLNPSLAGPPAPWPPEAELSPRAVAGAFART